MSEQIVGSIVFSNCYIEPKQTEREPWNQKTILDGYAIVPRSSVASRTFSHRAPRLVGLTVLA